MSARSSIYYIQSYPADIQNFYGKIAPTPPCKNSQKSARYSLYYIKSLQSCLLKNFTMGWLRLQGSFKLQVSFAKEPYRRDYILQKRHVILRSLLIVATSYRVQIMQFFKQMCPSQAGGKKLSGSRGLKIFRTKVSSIVIFCSKSSHELIF